MLSVVDQSPVRQGGTAAQALRETVELAQVAERLGYTRYWVAEHHNSASYSGASPEVLIGQIAANTSSIRVGSGGVMLSHYSALKVAEQFRVLDSFYPGRIDLGIGRAPGSDQLTAAALAYPRLQSDASKFPQQVMDLLGFLSGQLDGDHPFARVRAQPGPAAETPPQVWLLGSSDYSARLAALIGIPFAFADFFGDMREHGPIVAEIYRREFKPSASLAAPRVSVALQVLCAPTTEEASYLGASRNVNKAVSFRDQQWQPELQGLLPPKEAAAYPLNEQQQQFMDRFKKGYIDGNPRQVREGITEVAGLYGAREVGIVTNCYAFEDRVRSYELVAEAFSLAPRQTEER